MALACFLFLTIFPDLPLWSLPSLKSSITSLAGIVFLLVFVFIIQSRKPQVYCAVVLFIHNEIAVDSRLSGYPHKSGAFLVSLFHARDVLSTEDVVAELDCVH